MLETLSQCSQLKTKCKLNHCRETQGIKSKKKGRNNCSFFHFSLAAKLCYEVFSPDRLWCDPVQLQHQVPGKVSGGFRRVPVQIPVEVPEGSGADTW